MSSVWRACSGVRKKRSSSGKSRKSGQDTTILRSKQKNCSATRRKNEIDDPRTFTGSEDIFPAGRSAQRDFTRCRGSFVSGRNNTASFSCRKPERDHFFPDLWIFSLCPFCRFSIVSSGKRSGKTGISPPSGSFCDLFSHCGDLYSADVTIRVHGKGFTILLYILMGWACMAVLPRMLENLPESGFSLLLAGGIAYTIGVPFYIMRQEFCHALWHFFVLGGAILQFCCIYLTVQ